MFHIATSKRPLFVPGCFCSLPYSLLKILSLIEQSIRRHPLRWARCSDVRYWIKVLDI